MSVSYAYDALGRLVAVLDDNGEAAVYSYDAVGNLLGIARVPAGTPFIAAVVPTSARPGETIAIVGGGFGASASDTSVDLDGLPAVVVSSSRSVAFAAVPDGASTGLVRVTTASGSATAATPLVVHAARLSPVIEGFSPVMGAAREVVTIRGRGFGGEDTPLKVFIGSSACTVVRRTDSALDVHVPPGTGSGGVAVVTPAREAVSEGDFFIPPLPATVEMIEVTARMAVGETRSITLDATGTIALVVFDGTAGSRISLEATEVSIAHAFLFVFEPDGTPLMRREDIGTAFTEPTDPIVLRTAGTYSIEIAPTGGNAGRLVLHLHGVPQDVFGSIEIDGPPSTTGTVAPMQRAHLRFDGTSGETLGLGVTDVQLSDPIGTIKLILESPDGSETPFKLIGASPGTTASLPVLTQSGVHAIIIDPLGHATATLALRLSRPVSADAELDGPPIQVMIGRPGQDADIAFAAPAGIGVRVFLSTFDFTPADGSLTVVLVTSDGSVLASATMASDDRTLDVQALPAHTGPLDVRVHPLGITTTGLTVQVSTLASPG